MKIAILAVVACLLVGCGQVREQPKTHNDPRAAIAAAVAKK